MKINELLKQADEHRASDLIIKVSAPPLVRINGVLTPLDYPKLTAADTEALAKTLTTTAEWQRFERHHELDIAYSAPSLPRFRVNIFKQRGSVGLVLRRIASRIPTLEEIGLPQSAQELVMMPRGMVLVTGPAGSGKSTTQAALIDKRNQEDACHIVTIEDPIEFIHRDKKGIINQRQVGRDTLSFSAALKYVLRQDPDVILIGEMRDLETISMAVTVAETGHLLLGTLHTTDAAQTIDRVINAFPIDRQQQIRMQLSVNLVGVISQVLVPRSDGKGVVAAFEVMTATTAVKNCIRENKTFQIPQLLQTGADRGMVSMERSLARLINEGIVTAEAALSRAPRPQELNNLLPPREQKLSLTNFY